MWAGQNVCCGGVEYFDYTGVKYNQRTGLCFTMTTTSLTVSLSWTTNNISVAPRRHAYVHKKSSEALCNRMCQGHGWLQWVQGLQAVVYV